MGDSSKALLVVFPRQPRQSGGGGQRRRRRRDENGMDGKMTNLVVSSLCGIQFAIRNIKRFCNFITVTYAMPLPINAKCSISISATRLQWGTSELLLSDRCVCVNCQATTTTTPRREWIDIIFESQIPKIKGRKHQIDQFQF